MHRAGFIFAPNQNVGVFHPGAAASDIASLFTSIHSDTLTLTESTVGYYDDTAGQN